MSRTRWVAVRQKLGTKWASGGYTSWAQNGYQVGTKWAQSGHEVGYKVGIRWVGVILLTGKPFIGGDLHTLPLLPKSEFTLS